MFPTAPTQKNVTPIITQKSPPNTSTNNTNSASLPIAVRNTPNTTPIRSPANLSLAATTPATAPKDNSQQTLFRQEVRNLSHQIASYRELLTTINSIEKSFGEISTKKCGQEIFADLVAKYKAVTGEEPVLTNATHTIGNSNFIATPMKKVWAESNFDTVLNKIAAAEKRLADYLNANTQTTSVNPSPAATAPRPTSAKEELQQKLLREEADKLSHQIASYRELLTTINSLKQSYGEISTQTCENKVFVNLVAKYKAATGKEPVTTNATHTIKKGNFIATPMKTVWADSNSDAVLNKIAIAEKRLAEFNLCLS